METSEQQKTQDMDISVYDDVADFDLGEEVEKLKSENRMLGDHIRSLEEDIDKLTCTIIKLKENKDTLAKNISSLYLTAQTEIERKDRMIANLRLEIDNVCFRKRNSDFEYKRKERENSFSDTNAAKRFKYDRFDTYQDRSRSWSRYSPDRGSNNYWDDRGRRYDNTDSDRDRRFGYRENWNDDEDRRNIEMPTYSNKNFSYGDFRGDWTERWNRVNREAPLRQHKDEISQKSHDENKTREKDNSKENKIEKFQHISTTPQTLDSENKLKEKTVTKEQKMENPKGLIALSPVSSSEDKVEEESKSKKLQAEKSGNLKTTSQVPILEKEDISRGKPIRKRLKMLDVVEENIRRRRGTPIKSSNNSSVYQTRQIHNNNNIKATSRNSLDDLETKCKVITDRIVRDFQYLPRNENLKSGEGKSSSTVKSTDSEEKRGEIIIEKSKNVSVDSRKRIKTDDTDKNVEKDTAGVLAKKNKDKKDSKGVKDSKAHSSQETSTVMKEEFRVHDQYDAWDVGTSNKYSSKNKKENISCKNKNTSLDEDLKITNRKEKIRGIKGYTGNIKDYNSEERQDKKVEKELIRNKENTQDPDLNEVEGYTESSKNKNEAEEITTPEDKKKRILLSEYLTRYVVAEEKKKEEVQEFDKEDKKEVATVKGINNKSKRPENETKKEVVEVDVGSKKDGNVTEKEKDKQTKEKNKREVGVTEDVTKSSENEKRGIDKKCAHEDKLNKNVSKEESDISKKYDENKIKSNVNNATGATGESKVNKQPIEENTQNTPVVKDTSRSSVENSKDDRNEKELETKNKEISRRKETTDCILNSYKSKEKANNNASKEDESKTEIKDATNAIKLCKNEGKKIDKRRTSASSNSNQNEKTAEINETKGESCSKETNKKITSSEKDVTNAAKLNSKSVKGEMNIKINSTSNVPLNTESTIKGKQTNMSICARRKSCNESIREHILQGKAAEEKQLEQKVIYVKNDVQENAAVTSEKESSKNNSPVVSQAKNQTEDNRSNRRMSSDSKKPAIKVKEKTEATNSPKQNRKASKEPEIDAITVPEKNVDTEIPKEDENANKMKIVNVQKLNVNKECITDSVKKNKTENLKKAVKFSEERVPTITADNIKAEVPKSTRKNSEHIITSNVMRNKDLKRPASRGETAKANGSIASRQLKQATTNITKKDEKQENVSVINSDIKKNEKSNKPPEKDLIQMALAGILDSHEDKTETSVDGQKLDSGEPGKDYVKDSNVERDTPKDKPVIQTNFCVNNKSNQNVNKQTPKSGESKKKLKIEDISQCLQTKAQMRNHSKTESEAPKDISKHPKATEPSKPIKQAPKPTQETSPAISSANKDGIHNAVSRNNQNSTPDKKIVRRRITPTPVKDNKPLCSFENILGKTHTSPTFSNLSLNESPLHLTHEGEIPVLHLEENQINNLPIETNINDKNIMSLLDTMNISNMECELPKFKSGSESATNSETNCEDGNLNISPIKGNNNLTFENVISKASSTPVVPTSKNSSKENNTKVIVGIQNSVAESVTNSSGTLASSCAQTLTSPFPRRRRRCRLVIKD